VYLRNGEHGYGLVTKTLHWLTVAAFVAQFAVGLTMSGDDEAFDAEKDRIDRLEDAGEEDAERRGEAAEERFEAEIETLEDRLDAREDDYVAAAFDDIASATFLEDGLSLPEAHVLLGLSLIVLGVLRVLWRMTTPLPPWAPYLRPGERSLESALEKVLLAAMFVVPASGLALLAVGTDGLALHVAAQLMFLAAVAVHVALMLTHTRDGALSRML
jgi:cytochrome b561